MGRNHRERRAKSTDETRRSGLSLKASEFKTDQNRTLNELLLPWMKDGKSLAAVLPQSFVSPILTSERRGGPSTWKKLLQEWRNDRLANDIAIIGNAGSGKTMLFKYLYVFENGERDILYLKASVLREEPDALGPYERKVRAVLTGEHGIRKRKLVLLDGMDEAFTGDLAALDKVLSQLSGIDNVTVWYAWRSEEFYRQFPQDKDRLLHDVVRVGEWDASMAESYVSSYFEQVFSPWILERYRTLVVSSDALRDFSRNPFQLVLLVYLIENERIHAEVQAMGGTIVYKVFRSFHECWIEKELSRKTCALSKPEINLKLHECARALYYGGSYVVDGEDSVVNDLLVFSHMRGSRVATGFYHRSLCCYFCSDGIFNAVRLGDVGAIEAIRLPLRNDVTDYLNAAIRETLDKKEQSCVFDSLRSVYMRCVSPDRGRLSDEAEALLARVLASDEETLVLKSTLVYLITRMPNQDKRIREFLKQAHGAESNPYMQLSIGYGALLNGADGVALSYVESLKPLSIAEHVHRSWSLAYRGDVRADPYAYQDDGSAQWDRTREQWLKRLQSEDVKSLKLRPVIFAMLRCFYESRGWSDVCEGDLSVIKRASARLPGRSVRLNKFSEDMKSRLVRGYENALAASDGAPRRGRPHAEEEPDHD